MKDESIVYLDRVSKVYLSSGTEVYAVRNVTIDIKSGEFYSLLGSSGSGKTTTLRVIGGFEIPEYGQVFINGEEVTTQPPYQRNVHTVFQSYALFPHLNVAENIAYPLTIAKTPRSDIQSRVDESLRMFRIEGLGDRRPSQLSGGQQQRVALARALINRPKVLLLDEPLSALDAKVREEVRQELRELQRQTQITFIYVTHDQEEALALSDRIAVMHNGRVEQIGTPDQIYDRPQSLFVAQFIGKANLLTGEVQNVEANTALINIQGTVIKAAVHHPVTAGATATLMIRPERIQINSSTPAENQIKGRSIGATYTGQLLEIVAETAIGRLTVTQLSRQNLATGELTLSWNAQDCLMIPPDQG